MITLLLSDLKNPNVRRSDIARRAARRMAALDREGSEFFEVTQELRDELRDLEPLLHGLADCFLVFESAGGNDVSHITQPDRIGGVLRRIRELGLYRE